MKKLTRAQEILRMAIAQGGVQGGDHDDKKGDDKKGDDQVTFTADDLKTAIASAVGETVSAMKGEIDDLKKDMKTVDRRHIPALTAKASEGIRRGMGLSKWADKTIDEMSVEERADAVGRTIRYVFRARDNLDLAVQLAEKNGDKAIAKALAESVFEDGGALLPPEFASAITELLTPNTVVRGGSPELLTMTTGQIRIPEITDGATAEYIGENEDSDTSQLKTGQLVLSNKKLVTITPTSNDLLRSGGASADRMIRNDLMRAMRIKEDATFIRSDGSENKPKGFLFLVASDHKFAANSTFNSQNASNDLSGMLLKLEESDVEMRGVRWHMAPRTKRALMALLDADGRFTFKAEMLTGMLLGWPFDVTSQIPVNLGGGNDESEIYLVAYPTIVLAESTQMEIAAFAGGAYKEGSSIISGISRDQTVIRAISRHDFGARHRGEEISVLDQVKWAVSA